MTNVLELAAAHAARYLETLPTRPIAATASIADLHERLAKPLPEIGLPDATVIDELVRDTEGGIMGSAGGRFFGWVIGGSHPVGVAAEWLTAAWGQNAGNHIASPAAAATTP